jgi:hypothetical protein
MRVDELKEQQLNTKSSEAKELLQKKINSDNIKLSKLNTYQLKFVNSRPHLIRDKRRETVKIIVNDLGTRYQVEGLENL